MPISGACDNHCVFCMDDWSLSSFISVEEIEKKLKAAREYTDEITFSSLEPTLHPHILEIVAKAKGLWFRAIELVTNGNRLKDRTFCESLIHAGVNIFSLSIHSHIPEIHDALVRKPWAFEETITGLKHLAELGKTSPISIAIGTVVSRLNYQYIYESVKFFEYFSVDDIVLNVLQVKNSALSHISQIAVQYSLLVEEFQKLLPLQEKYHNIQINGFVPCISEKLVTSIWYFNGAWVMPDASGNYSVALPEGKSKRTECSSCKYYNQCDGIWDSYVQAFGWDEFIPVK